MDAPVGWLVQSAEELVELYGWGSTGLFQRRLRVTRIMAEYLERELRAKGSFRPLPPLVT